MPINKVVASFEAAVADIPDGATLMIDGFAGPGGTAQNLIRALRDHGARDLTIISNTAGLASVTGFGTRPGDRPIDIGILVDNEQVRKVVASYPVSPSPSRPTSFERAYKEGKVDLELVPQGTLAERIRAGGAGIPAFYTPTGAGTVAAEGKEVRDFGGREFLLEEALSADFALVRAHQADPFGNVRFWRTARNFAPLMATAATTTIVETDHLVPLGGIDPDDVHLPGVFVHRIVEVMEHEDPFEYETTRPRPSDAEAL
jgi:3-oxoacid CoA-transferase A subunit